jgi:putative ubiquitin-RnfH superfamily antitoxin RatB of RatAB toxin-antitoxin module
VTAATIRVEVVRAWPRRHASVVLELPAGATVSDAMAACGLALDGINGQAVFGERVASTDVLRDGDRLELLQPLLVDPKEARRRRAGR